MDTVVKHTSSITSLSERRRSRRKEKFSGEGRRWREARDVIVDVKSKQDSEMVRACVRVSVCARVREGSSAARPRRAAWARQECCGLVVVSALPGDHFARVTAESVQTLPASLELTETSDKHTQWACRNQSPKLSSGNHEMHNDLKVVVFCLFFWELKMFFTPQLKKKAVLSCLLINNHEYDVNSFYQL